MALSAAIAFSPLTLTVTSDRRQVHVELTCNGDTAEADATYPITVTDSARTWTLASDNGATAVYTA